MPWMEYECNKGHRFDELFLGTETVPDVLACRCGALADRRTVYRFRVVGPVFEHLETYEKALFTDRERAQGKRIRSAKDIAAAEREQGIHREDATFYRVAREEMQHEDWQIKQAADGDSEKALDFVEDMQMKEATGWDNKQLNEYKEAVNAVEATVTPTIE